MSTHPAPSAESTNETTRFYFDLQCPYSYVAAARLHKQLGGFQRPLHYVPVLLDVLTLETGGPTAPNRARSTYQRHDVTRLAEHYRLPLVWPRRMPDTRAAQAALARMPAQERPAACQLLFQALWVEGQNIGELHVLEALLGPARLDADGEGMEQLLRDSLDAAAAGVFGVPTFEFEGDLYFGQDRLFLIEQRISERILARSV